MKANNRKDPGTPLPGPGDDTPSGHLVPRKRSGAAGVDVLRDVPNVGDPCLPDLEGPHGTGLRRNRVQENAGRFVVQYLGQLPRRQGQRAVLLVEQLGSVTQVHGSIP